MVLGVPRCTMFRRHPHLHCWTVDPRNAALKDTGVHNVASWHVCRQLQGHCDFRIKQNVNGSSMKCLCVESRTSCRPEDTGTAKGIQVCVRKITEVNRLPLKPPASAGLAQNLLKAGGVNRSCSGSIPRCKRYVDSQDRARPALHVHRHCSADSYSKSGRYSKHSYRHDYGPFGCISCHFE